MTTQGSYEGLALRFDSRKDAHNSATLHRSDCKMVTAVKPRGPIAIITKQLAEEVEDLIERDYKVIRCKCCK
jgi:hypothetical protein